MKSMTVLTFLMVALCGVDQGKTERPTDREYNTSVGLHY